jgi:hypothetical protein
MTSKAAKCLALFILTLILTYPSLAQAVSLQEYTFPQEKTVVLPKGALISVQNISGDIEIHGEDQNQVVIRTTKRVKARSQKEAEEWAEKVNINFDDRAEGLFIEVKMPKGWAESLGSLLTKIFEKQPSVQVDFDIRTPREVEVKVASVSGDVLVASVEKNVAVDVVSGDLEISHIGGDLSIDAISSDMVLQDVAGDLDIDAISSDMEVTNIDGDVSIDVTSGDLTGKHIRGKCTVDGTSGDVNVTDVSGDVHIDVTSGDIRIRQKGGKLWIDTSSGDVSVETIVEKNGRYRVDTSSGQIRFYIPKTSSCKIDLETSGGRIHAKLPMVVETVSRTRLQGTIGSGEAQITLSTSGGDIELLPSD